MRTGFLRTLAGGAIAVGTIFGALAQAAAGEVRVLSFGGASNLPIWVAQEKGLFEKEGIKFSFALTTGSVAQIKDFYEGKHDVISTAFDNIVAYAEGQSDVPLPGPYDMFAFLGISGGLNSIMVTPEIASYADIKGKTVAVDALKSGYGLLLYQVLKDRAGLEFDKDYKALPVGNTDRRLVAMREQKAVAAVIGTPQDMEAERGGLKLMSDAAIAVGAYQGTAFVTRKGYASANEADLLAFIRAIVAAQDLIFADKATAIAVLKKNSKGLSDADAEKLYQRMVAPGGLTPRANMDIKGVENVLKMRETYGEPQKKMGPVSRYVDMSFYDKALAKK